VRTIGEGAVVGWAGLMKVGVMMVSTLTVVILRTSGEWGRLKLYGLYRDGAKKESVASCMGSKWMVRDRSGVDIFGKTLE